MIDRKLFMTTFCTPLPKIPLPAAFVIENPENSLLLASTTASPSDPLIVGKLRSRAVRQQQGPQLRNLNEVLGARPVAEHPLVRQQGDARSVVEDAAGMHEHDVGAGRLTCRDRREGIADGSQRS